MIVTPIIFTNLTMACIISNLGIEGRGQKIKEHLVNCSCHAEGAKAVRGDESQVAAPDVGSVGPVGCERSETDKYFLKDEKAPLLGSFCPAAGNSGQPD